MPVSALDQTGRSLSSWSIVGAVRGGVVTHVGLLGEDRDYVTHDDAVPVLEMGPPFATLLPESPEDEDDPANAAESRLPQVLPMMPAHLTATLEDLDDDDRQGMRRWHRTTSAFFPASLRPSRRRRRQVAEWARFLEQCHYIAHPPILIEVDPVTGRDKAHWYSCAGFVIAAYESTVVEKVLASWQLEDFPTVGISELEAAFCPRRMSLTPELRKVIGVAGDEPWPVVMPGYVVAAFVRPSQVVRQEPYLPIAADRFSQTPAPDPADDDLNR